MPTRPPGQLGTPGQVGAPGGQGIPPSGNILPPQAGQTGPAGAKRNPPKYGEGGAPAAPAHAVPILPVEEPVAEPLVRRGASDFLYQVGDGVRTMLDSLEGVAAWALRLAMGFGGLSLVYLLFAIFVGHAGDLKGNPDAAQLTTNMHLAAEVFSYAVVVGLTAGIIIAYGDNKLGAMMAGLGAAFQLAIPPLLFKLVGQSAATMAIGASLRPAGFVMVVIGLFKATIDLIIWLIALPEQMRAKATIGVGQQAEAKQLAVARDANMFSPCWKLPFCREVIRKQCPAFLAKSTCWKFGRGCYCDEEMIGRIIRGESLAVIKSPTRMSRTGKPPCDRCYIFLEHQTHKFRMLSPMALPAAIILMTVAWPTYTRVFNAADQNLGKVFAGISVAPPVPDALKSSGIDPDADTEKAQQEQIEEMAMYMLGILCGFIVLIYISKGIEWAIYKAKL